MMTATAPSVDLGQYCARIRYSGTLEPSLPVLNELIAHHTASIPFENIDVLLDRGIDISPQAVDAKLISGNRGGYCFEHNGLFKRVLSTIGFKVDAHAARVMWGAKEDGPPRPRTHMALQVHLDQSTWLVDVGFGGPGPTKALRFDQASPQETEHETFRIVRQSSEVILQAQRGESWEALYQLSTVTLLDVDFEPPNWFTSTHPQSVFKQDLMASLTTRDARFTLLNNGFTVRHRDGLVERHNLNADELEATLRKEFGLAVEPSWRPMLEGMAKPKR